MASKDAEPSTEEPRSGVDNQRDQDGMDDDELVTPGAQTAQSEGSHSEQASLDPSAEDEELPVEEEKPRRKGLSRGSKPTPAASTAFKKTRFGLENDQTSGRKKEKEQNEPQNFSTFDYTTKYPRDKRYEELHNEARVWLTYNDEAAIFDMDMVGEAADSLDILLVFAGLFAAVLTTFVAQTSQSLSPDNSAVTVSLLVELVAVQRAAITGSSLSDIAAADVAPAIDRTSIWVNALWFTSLALSLASALLAVLSKQWLRQYTSFIAGSARERALIRQFRYDGMEKWAVRTIIGLLPTILHLSLAFFLSGLVVFLAPLQRGIAISVGIISGALFIAYISSIVIAVVHVKSPYRTTFSDVLSTTLRWIFTAVYPVFERNFGLPHVALAPTTRAAEQMSAINLEEKTGAEQACHALEWLHNTTGSVSAKTLIMESLCAFPLNFFDGKQDVFIRLSNGCGPDRLQFLNWVDERSVNTVQEWEILLRTICLSGYGPFPVFTDVVSRRYEYNLNSDVSLAVVYSASSHVYYPESQYPQKGSDIEFDTLRGLFSASTALTLNRLSLDHKNKPASLVTTFLALGRVQVPPIVWNSLLRQREGLTSMSPHHLDNWPSHISLRDYLSLADFAKIYHSLPARTSVFQNPIGLFQFTYPILEELGWYRTDSANHGKDFHNAVKPLVLQLPEPWRLSAEEELEPSPPDEDAVWEPAVYPSEWPPFPAPTWAEAWQAAEDKYKADEEEPERARNRKALDAAEHVSVGKALSSGIRKLVRGRLCSGDESVGETGGMV